MYADGTMKRILAKWKMSATRAQEVTATGDRRVLAAFDWHILWDRIFHPDHAFALALCATVFIAVVAQVLGVVLGLVAALMRMSKLWPLRALSDLYVLVFRGTPLIVQIFFVYYGANLLLGFTLIPNDAQPRLRHDATAPSSPASSRSGSTRARTCARSSAPASMRSTGARWRRRSRSG